MEKGDQGGDRFVDSDGSDGEVPLLDRQPLETIYEDNPDGLALTEKTPIALRKKSYSAVDQSMASNTFSTVKRPSLFQESEGKNFTAYMASVSQSLRYVSQSMYFHSVIGEGTALDAKSQAVSFRTLSLADLPSNDRRISTWLMFFTTLNMMSGLTMFTFPYLIVRSGPSILVAIALVGVLSLYTSLLVNTCQYQTSRTTQGFEKRVYTSFIDLGKAALKPYGEILMQAVICSNVLGEIGAINFMGQVTMTLFRNPTPVALQLSEVTWGILILPCLFISRMSVLVWIATIGLVGYIGALGATYGLLISSFRSWSFGELAWHFDWEYFFIGYGIILSSYNIHVMLPSTEGCARRPEKFRAVMKASFALNIGMKLLLAVIGVAAFGALTKGTLLTNLKEKGVISFIINCIVAFHLYTNRPTSMFVLTDLMDKYLQPRMTLMQPGTKGHYVWVLLSRLILILFTVFISLLVPRFELIASLSGFIRGTINSIVCPVAFYLSLRKRHISKFSFVMHCALIIVATCAGLLGIAITVKAIITEGK